MKKTLFVTHWPGGGVWGLKQLVQARYMEEQTGMRMADLTDLHISSSIGALPGNALLVPDDKDPSKPKFKAGDLIEPFKDCAAQMFGKEGIAGHYELNIQHDLRQTLECGDGRVAKLASRLLHDRTGKLHKPHRIFGDFLDDYVGDVKVDELLKSSITQVHHMETVSRACFLNLKNDLFDQGEWHDEIIANHGGLVTVKDTIMATTAAPTVFNAYEIGDDHYVDFDHAYSPLAPLQLAMQCLKGHALPHVSNALDVQFLKMTCGDISEITWDHKAYANQGPLALEKDLISNAGLDQQRVDHAMIEVMIGANNVVFIGADTAHLTNEADVLPSGDIFDGNISNLDKIENFAQKYAVTQRENMMRYAENVVETRTRENVSNPSTAFSFAANENDPAIERAEPNKGWFDRLGRLGGLSLGRFVSSFTI